MKKTNKGVSWFSHNKIELQSIINSLNEAKEYASGSLLDIGCGSKPYYPLFSQNVSHYVGIDIAYHLPSRKNVDVWGDFESLPFKPKSFGTILCTQVLEYIPHPSNAVEEMLRVLKPGGHVILTVPLDSGFGEKNDYFRFTEQGIRHLFEEKGFEIEYIKPRGGLFALIGHTISNHLYYVFGYRRFIIQYLLIRFICMVVQLIFYTLDKIHPAYENTLGYIVVARKKETR